MELLHSCTKRSIYGVMGKECLNCTKEMKSGWNWLEQKGRHDDYLVAHGGAKGCHTDILQDFDTADDMRWLPFLQWLKHRGNNDPVIGLKDTYNNIADTNLVKLVTQHCWWYHLNKYWYRKIKPLFVQGNQWLHYKIIHTSVQCTCICKTWGFLRPDWCSNQ